MEDTFYRETLWLFSEAQLRAGRSQTHVSGEPHTGTPPHLHASPLGRWEHLWMVCGRQTAAMYSTT